MKQLRLNDNIYYEKIDNEIVILNANTDRYQSLNETASFIFEGIISQGSEEDIIQRVMDTYDAVFEDVKYDYDKTISILVEMKVLTYA